MKLYHTITLIVILLFLLILTQLDIKNIKPKELYYNTLVKLNILKPCYSPIINFKEIFQQEGFDYELTNKKVVESSLNKLLDKSIGTNLKIPAITHHIYFTHANSSKKLIDFYVSKMKANYNRLNELGVEWKHYIWTNNPSIFPEEIIQIKGVEIKSIKVLEDHILYKSLVDAINSGEKLKAYFSESSDILRFIAIEKFGGIYNDMDYEIYNAKTLYNLMHKFDFIGGREHNEKESYYGSAFLAAKPNHPILNDAITRKHRNMNSLDSPKYIKYPCNLYAKIYFNAPPLITLAYFAKNNLNGNNDVILPSWMIFNLKFARFKNKTCDFEKITKDEFNNNLDELVLQFNKINVNIGYYLFFLTPPGGVRYNKIINQ